MDTDLPQPVPLDPGSPPDELPTLPEGYVWGLKITAEAEVIPGPDPREEQS